jgi:hypothetical protein
MLERVEEVIDMGKKLGFTPLQWGAILATASGLIARRHNFTITQVQIVPPVQCECEKCKKQRAEKARREGIHVVN